MITDTYEQLRRAVRERLQVSAEYDGRPRQFCPHVVGTTAGEPRCFAYQFGGETSTGPLTAGAWRCFRIDKLTGVRVRPGEWHTGAAPTRPQTCVKDVDVAVD